MDITPNNPVEQEALLWAINQLRSEDWDDPFKLMVDCSVAESEVHEISKILSGLHQYRPGPLSLPDSEEGNWVARDLAVRIGEDLVHKEEADVAEAKFRMGKTPGAVFRVVSKVHVYEAFSLRILSQLE